MADEGSFEKLETPLRPTPQARNDTGEERQIGPYRLLERLGEGGMGEVWLAEQTAPVRRRVALKVIKRGMDTEAVVARFAAERQALALMDHPAVAKVFEAGSTPQGRPYFVMEHVRGVPITEHCDRHKLGTRERLALFVQVCEGVQHAHQKAILHRDLKPSNVLVTEQDSRRQPKIIDFGVAKATTQRLTERTVYTELGVLIGTPEYMSPEQAEMTGEDVDTRTDVYSLGVMLYELLVGALPFESRELRESGYEEMRRKIRENEPRKPSARLSALAAERSMESAGRRAASVPALVRQLRGDLDWIVMKALEKDRARRYGSPAELAADVESHLRNQPVLAGPPSAAYRARKFVRRHRLGVGIAATGVVVLAGFAATMAAQARRIAVERDRATEVLGYLKRVFEVSDPSEARGGAITARELLDRSAARLDEQLADQPPLHAEMAATMGEVYANLGLYDRAEPLLSTALQTRRRLLGDRHPDTLTSIDAMATLRQSQGRYDEAEAEFVEAVEGRRRSLGGDHPLTLASINNLGLLLKERGRPAEAEGHLREALEGQRRVLGADDVDSLTSLNNLAMVLADQGKLAEAEACYREALVRKRRVIGADHPETLATINNLGLLLRGQGKPAEAEGYFREALDGNRRVFGAEHPRTLASIHNMGLLLRDQEKLAEAEGYFREAVEGRRRVLGADHPLTALSLANLGVVLNKQKRFAQAEPLLRQALAIYPKQLDAGHWWISSARSSLGESLASLGRHAEAEPLLLEGQRAMEASTEASARHKHDAVERLVALYATWGRRDDEARWRAKLAELP